MNSNAAMHLDQQAKYLLFTKLIFKAACRDFVRISKITSIFSLKYLMLAVMFYSIFNYFDGVCSNLINVFPRF